MAPTTPTGVPAELVAGDSWRWRIPDVSDYPQSEGWALKYELVGVGTPLSISPTFQTSGDDENHWLVSEATSATTLTKGRYRLIGRMVGSGTFAGREETISDTVVLLHADPRTATAGDFQTHAELMVTVLEAAVETMVSADKLIEQYGLAGRQVSKMPHMQRVKLLSEYRWQLHTDREGTIGRRVATRFVAAS